MRLFRSFDSSSSVLPSVIALGNFDGLHLGHQWLVSHIVNYAQSHHLRSCILTFDPMPSEFFSSLQPPSRLMRLIEKWNFLQSFALDEVYVCRFTEKLAKMTAHDFIEKILVANLQVKHIVIGDNFRFGFQREGDVALLKKQSRIFGYSVKTHTEFSPLVDATPRQIISSTLIRHALKAGDFSLAEKLLGHPYKNIGRVVYGAQLGRQLGCPTANIPMRRRVSPVHGVYVVSIKGDGIHHYGVASVGHRPAIGGHPEFLLEVHLFDFNGDLYGKRLEVTYLKKLRDEWMFDSLDALKTQIAIDCKMAKDNLNEIIK